jgi:hypothetical protein
LQLCKRALKLLNANAYLNKKKQHKTGAHQIHEEGSTNHVVAKSDMVQANVVHAGVFKFPASFLFSIFVLTGNEIYLSHFTVHKICTGV